jgi:ubiquinone/menaquinone biosynthesis C-methylase UbiE
MGVWGTQVLPRLIDRLLDNRDVRELRRRAIEGLHGTVLEIGFGSGLNVALYPPEVDRVFAVDPALVGRKLAEPRVLASSVDVEYLGLDGQSLPLGDESVDSALSTFTLCTIPDAPRALREIARVLKPGGDFHFVEHGLAPDPDVVKWQLRIEPINRRLAGGCHLTRRHDAMLAAAGFEPVRLDKEYGHGPKPYTYHYIGVVRKPA